MFWYEEDIRYIEKKIDTENNPPYTVFYGSSSIRLWDHLERDFNRFNGLNLGFGGSTMAACVWYYERVFSKMQPSSIVLYAGDNDLGDNRHPEEVFIFYQQLLHKIRTQYGNIPVFFVSIKPSISRFHIVDRIKYTNKIIHNEIINDHNNTFYINLYDKMVDDSGFPIRSYFMPDGLHLNANGYDVWKDVIYKKLNDNLPVEYV